MSLSFKGPVPVPAKQSAPLNVLITGASRGIGFELVRQYVDAHADNIVFAAVRDPSSKNSDAVNALAAKHTNLHVIPLDTANEDTIKKSASHVTKVTDHLDILINNAGISGENDPLKVTTEQLLDVFKVNVAGPITVIQTYLPLLQKSTQGGKVIQVSSGLGSNELAFMLGFPFIAYGISKAALNYMNTVFKHAVPEVTFLTVSPGWVSTDMGNASGNEAPTKVTDSVQAFRYYVAEKTTKNSGEFFDIMTGDIIPY